LRWALVIAATQAAARPAARVVPWPPAAQGDEDRVGGRGAALAEIAYQVYQVWKEDSDYIAVLRRTSVRG